MPGTDSSTADKVIKLRLVVPTGAPAGGEWVTLLDPTGVPLHRLRTGSDGILTVPAGADGELTFRVGKGAGDAYVVDLKGLVRQAGAVDVPIQHQTKEAVRMYGQLVERTGQPAPGVGMVVMRKKDKAALAGTVSDSNGAFLLTFTAPGTDSDEYVLELSVNKDPIPMPDLEKVSGGLYGPHTFVVEHQPHRTGACVAPRPVLIGSEEETLAAFKKAPQLFTRPVACRPPDPCSPYTPTEVATRVFELNQLIMFPLPSQEGTTGTTVVSNPIAKAIGFVDGRPALPQSQPLRYGALMDFRQEWWDLGFSLGNLLYSVPLAPCEETKIATVDWRRKDFAKRQTALDESFFQDTTISRDEAINEAVRMTSDKHVTDTTEGGGGGISLGFISGGYGKTVEKMDDVGDASTTASEYINDRIRQVSNTLRNTRAFAIVEATEEEESVVRTRVLRNHNHCHTVTFQYYEVLRHFLISTKVAKIRPAVLVPFDLLLFTPAMVSRYGYVLRRALLDPTLAPTLDGLLGVAQNPAPQAPAPPSTTDLGPRIIKGFRFSAVPLKRSTSKGNTTTTSESGWTAETLFVAEDYPIETEYELTFAAASTGGSMKSWADVQMGNVRILFSALRRVGIQSTSPDDLFFDDVVVWVDLSVGGAPEWHEVLVEQTIDLPSERRFMKERESHESAGGTTQPISLDTGRLIEHLNAYSPYYTTALISGGDAGSRYLALSAYTDDAGVPLTDIIDNTVVGSIGNYAAFPLQGPDHLPASYGTVEASWLSEPPDERIVTLPTPGVFAESQLGSCSACEKIDQTRFWDWQKSPCPEEAPAIDSAMLASRYQNLKDLLDVVKSNLVPATVQIPEQPKPLIQIGDGTLTELLKIGKFSGSKDLLDFIGKVVDIAAKGFKDLTSSTNTQSSGQGGLGNAPGGSTSEDGADAGGDAGAEAAGAAEGAGLDASAATAAEAAVII